MKHYHFSRSLIGASLTSVVSFMLIAYLGKSSSVVSFFSAGALGASIAAFVIAGFGLFRQSYELGRRQRMILERRTAVRSPNLGRKLLVFFVPKKQLEHLVGDLDEEFKTYILPELGPHWANVWYFFQVAKTIVATNRWIVWVAGSVGGLGGIATTIGAILKRRGDD